MIDLRALSAALVPMGTGALEGYQEGRDRAFQRAEFLHRTAEEDQQRAVQMALMQAHLADFAAQAEERRRLAGMPVEWKPLTKQDKLDIEAAGHAPPAPRNIDRLSTEGIAAELQLLAEEKRRGLLRSPGGELTADAALRQANIEGQGLGVLGTPGTPEEVGAFGSAYRGIRAGNPDWSPGRVAAAAYGGMKETNPGLVPKAMSVKDALLERSRPDYVPPVLQPMSADTAAVPKVAAGPVSTAFSRMVNQHANPMADPGAAAAQMVGPPPPAAKPDFQTRKSQLSAQGVPKDQARAQLVSEGYLAPDGMTVVQP